MKRTKSKYTIKRLSSSPYFTATFLELEQKSISKIQEAEMLPIDSFECASILITNTHTDLTHISKDQLKACQLIIHPNSGYDNFSSDFVSHAHFPIIIGNPIRSHAVSNYILSCLFSHYSPITAEGTWNKNRQWARKLLSELTILILGAGHIGNILNKSLSPLVKEMRIYDPYQGFLDLNLKDVDVLIPACSLNEKNKYFINKEILLNLNEDFLFINAARGNLVNTGDLVSILSKRPNSFAFLDVFEKEPADFNQFKNISNLSLSSHIAGVYTYIDHATIEFENQVISDFTRLDPLEFENIYKKMNLKNKIIDQKFLI